MSPDTARRFRDAKIVGIVNITRDSFSDGGRYLDPARAVEHARQLVADGADLLDLGPASSHPDAESVPASEEIRRLEPVATALLADGIPLSVDSPLPETQLWAASHGFAQLNDIRGFPDPETVRGLAEASCQLVVMHSIQGDVRADRRAADPQTVRDGVARFFERRCAELEAAGIARSRLILDPGMGFFLGSTPAPSIAVLQELDVLAERFGLPIYVSVSRKSFLGVLTDRPTDRRGSATLAAELFAIEHGASFVRTHDPGALRDGCRVLAALHAPAGSH